MLNCTRAFISSSLIIDGNVEPRRDALAVFIVEQVALNRHAFEIFKPDCLFSQFLQNKARCSVLSSHTQRFESIGGVLIEWCRVSTWRPWRVWRELKPGFTQCRNGRKETPRIQFEPSINMLGHDQIDSPRSIVCGTKQCKQFRGSYRTCLPAQNRSAVDVKHFSGDVPRPVGEQKTYRECNIVGCGHTV